MAERQKRTDLLKIGIGRVFPAWCCIYFERKRTRTERRKQSWEKSADREFVSKELRRAITYTIEGFCDFADISRQSFYDTYGSDPEFADIVTRIRESCEVDARKKFELGIIPSQLAGLWMSKHGYSTKTDNTVTGALPVVITGGDDLED